MLFALLFPTSIHPIAYSIGRLDIHWYGIAYALGIAMGFILLKYLNKKSNTFSDNVIDHVLVYFIIGDIIGARLGYVLFYMPQWIISNPLQILKIWEGGVSFHGGLIGVIISLFILSKKFNIAFFAITDIVSCVAPVGLFFGRLANFINGELCGNITSIPWGMVFPWIGSEPRHPSQIYEALTEGLILLILMLIFYNKTNLRKKKGMLSGLFLVLYSIARIICEFFRSPDAHIGFLFLGSTMGQLLSLPLFFIGIYICIISMHKAK